MNKDFENSEVRWAWAKMYVEPRIKEASNDETAEALLPNHEFLIRSTAKKQLIVKCRKTAFSWGVALDALARAATEPRSSSFIISYDEEESKNKNRFIDWIYGVLPPEVKNELKISQGTEERRTANGSVIKFTSKAPTGSGATYYCDEFSVKPKNGTSPAEILTAAIGGTTHTGYIRVGGTQRGPETLFNKILTGEWGDEIGEGMGLSKDELTAIDWEIGKFPWWSSPALVEFPYRVQVLQGEQRQAAQLQYLQEIRPLCESMNSHERVKEFGNSKLKGQYISYCNTPEQGLSMFQREFEMEVLDEAESYFSTDLIRSCIAAPTPKYWFARSPVITGEKLTLPQQKGEANIEDAHSIIRRVQSASRSGELQGNLGAAMDVARDSDLAVIAIGNVPYQTPTRISLRALILMHKVPFPAMKRIWYSVLQELPINRGCLDSTKGSLGRGMGEEAHQKFAQKSLPFEFTPTNQLTAIAGLKGRMENSGLELPPEAYEGDIEKEFAAIKRLQTGVHGMTFLVPRNATGHCDIFITIAMLGTLFDAPAQSSVEIATGQMPQNNIAQRLAHIQSGAFGSARGVLPMGGARAAAARLKSRSMFGNG